MAPRPPDLYTPAEYQSTSVLPAAGLPLGLTLWNPQTAGISPEMQVEAVQRDIYAAPVPHPTAAESVIPRDVIEQRLLPRPEMGFAQLWDMGLPWYVLVPIGAVGGLGFWALTRQT